MIELVGLVSRFGFTAATYCIVPCLHHPHPLPRPLSPPRRPYPHCNVVLQQQCIIALSSSRCYRIYVPHVQLAYDRNTNEDNICNVRAQRQGMARRLNVNEDATELAHRCTWARRSAILRDYCTCISRSVSSTSQLPPRHQSHRLPRDIALCIALTYKRRRVLVYAQDVQKVRHCLSFHDALSRANVSRTDSAHRAMYQGKRA